MLVKSNYNWKWEVNRERRQLNSSDDGRFTVKQKMQTNCYSVRCAIHTHADTRRHTQTPMIARWLAEDGNPYPVHMPKYHFHRLVVTASGYANAHNRLEQWTSVALAMAAIMELEWGRATQAGTTKKNCSFFYFTLSFWLYLAFFAKPFRCATEIAAICIFFSWFVSAIRKSEHKAHHSRAE